MRLGIFFLSIIRLHAKELGTLRFADVLYDEACERHAKDGCDVGKGAVGLHFVKGLATVLKGFPEVG